MVACFTASRPLLEARQVLQHQPAVGLVVEFLLDQLRGRRDRQVHGFLAQRQDRLLLLGVDLAARAIEQPLLLFAGLGEQRFALLGRHRFGLGEDLLRLGPGLLQAAPLLLQQLRRLGARLFGLVELALDAPLALLDRLEDRRPAELPQQGKQQAEHDQGPENQPPVDRERSRPRGLVAALLQEREQAGHQSSLNSRANTRAASVAPSMSAAVRIIAPRMSPEACGCRAIASTACPPMRPMPVPAPMIATPSPMPAPRRGLVFLATSTAAS